MKKKLVSIAVLDYSVGIVDILDNVPEMESGLDYEEYLSGRGYHISDIAFMVSDRNIEVAVTDTTNNSTSWIL